MCTRLYLEVISSFTQYDLKWEDQTWWSPLQYCINLSLFLNLHHSVSFRALCLFDALCVNWCFCSDGFMVQKLSHCFWKRNWGFQSTCSVKAQQLFHVKSLAAEELGRLHGACKELHAPSFILLLAPVALSWKEMLLVRSRGAGLSADERWEALQREFNITHWCRNLLYTGEKNCSWALV